jgi:hypothetical protein
MAMVSYLLGRRYYPIAYDIKRVLVYITLGIGLFFAKQNLPIGSGWQQSWLVSSELIALYILITLLFEKRQFLMR